MNSVNIIGRITGEPELRYTTSNIPVLSFRIAWNKKYRDKEESHFFNVVAWRNNAEFIRNHFGKGDLIGISGRLQQRSYEKDGEKRSVAEILVQDVSFCGGKKKPQEIEDFQEAEEDGDVPF